MTHHGVMNDERTSPADPSPDPDTGSAEPEVAQRLVTRAKATFQWPPECAWPFLDRKSDNDT